ncbi:MAG: RNase E specificity factor CsrD, partial [Enterobacteriaceae bacterium]
MRLTTKFSAFVTLLTSLTIFVTLIGASLSFYNGIQLKMENRVQAVATMLDNRLISSSFDKLEPQMDELMTPVEIVQVDFLLNGKPVYGHSRSDSYRPPGSKNQYREITVPSLKHPGMTIHVVYLDPMVNYFRSLHITGPLSIAIGLMVLVIFFSVRWIRRQLAGQELLEVRAARIL